MACPLLPIPPPPTKNVCSNLCKGQGPATKKKKLSIISERPEILIRLPGLGQGSGHGHKQEPLQPPGFGPSQR